MKRNTVQRRAIRGVLEEAGCPLAPVEIRAAALARCPGIGMATVYRALRALMEEGRVDPVAIPGGPPRYELRRAVHHHHFVCRGCERVYRVEGCLQSLIADLTPPGFRLEDHDMTLYGRCSSCSANRH